MTSKEFLKFQVEAPGENDKAGSRDWYVEITREPPDAEAAARRDDFKYKGSPDET